MDPSARETDINPYLPPSETEDPTAPKGPPVLKDLRLRGWFAISAISLQSVIGSVPLFIPASSTVMLGRIMVMQVVSLSLAIILFLRWIHGVAVNTRRINPQSSIGPGWSVGCHFVPFVNWVMPCIHMRAFIRECHPQGAPAGMLGLVIAWWITYQFRGIVLKLIPWVGFGEILGPAAWVVFTLVSWSLVWFLVTRISRRHFEFRWSDLPAARRPQMLTQMAKIARLESGALPPSGPAGAALPPRRVAQRPISLEEQSRLIHQMDASCKPDTPPPP